MSIGKRIALGVTANWISRAVAIAMGVIVLPVLFRNLSKEELGAWLLLGQSAVAFGIFEFGFGATLSRRVAFAKGKSGSDPAAPFSDASLLEIADLITTGERIYRYLSVFAFVFSFGLGFLYLRSLHLTTIPVAHVWIAWTILCSARRSASGPTCGTACCWVSATSDGTRSSARSRIRSPWWRRSRPSSLAEA